MYNNSALIAVANNNILWHHSTLDANRYNIVFIGHTSAQIERQKTTHMDAVIVSVLSHVLRIRNKYLVCYTLADILLRLYRIGLVTEKENQLPEEWKWTRYEDN